MTASLSIPAPPAAPRQTTGSDTAPVLMSSGTPLSIPTTTFNFTRFVSRAGPVFWIQDRVEEIVMWRKGNAYTAAWLAAYAFICYFPRLVLLIPHAVLITILLATYSSKKPDAPAPPPASYLQSYQEGSAGWYANLQAIQNLMGAVSDGYDAALLAVPLATHASPYSTPLLVVLVVSFVAMLPVLPFIPLRPTFLVLGIAPLIVTHPVVQQRLPAALVAQQPLIANARMSLQQFIDDDRLAPEVWYAPLESVELWENERWDTPHNLWSKQALQAGERRAWTRARDGWSGVDGEGSLSHTTFALEPGWSFIETESWRVDLAGTWVPSGADSDGWVYTNDAWQEPQPSTLAEWKAKGMTRRRRWTRRIYYQPPKA
ncbi:Peroxin/Dysferlin domain-containing protein [Auriculariales sp. MPI-PUGE-AT-0066]|nr:Peroxin/Dysferlin domain-containing protein [Auriculariales sp. MPI-PUGE-AT-0066]